MSVRRWKLQVTELGEPAPLAEAVVEAANWMAGIKVGRGKVGEPEAIPPGASCTVAPDGRVTVFDSARRRSYVLTPVGDGEPLRVSMPGSMPPPRPSMAPTAAAGGAKQGLGASLQASNVGAARPPRPKTMGFAMDGPMPQAGVAIPIGQPSPSSLGGRPAAVPEPPPSAPSAAPQSASPPMSSAKAAMRRTMAFVPGQFDLPPLPSREVVVGTPATRPSATPPPDQRPSAPPRTTAVPERPPAPGTTTDTVPPPRPSSASTSRPAEAARGSTSAERPSSVGARPAGAPAPRSSSASSRPDAKGAQHKVIFERHVKPSDESPLYYDVVGAWVPAGGETLALEKILLTELDRLRGAIAQGSEGHLIQVFLYATPAAEIGDGSEIASLTHRGWRGESHLRFPRVEEAIAGETMPDYDAYAAASEDVRLEEIFAAFDDVWFLATPREGLEFAARLIEEMFDGVHVIGCGRSRDGEAFVPAAERGSLPGYGAPKQLEIRSLAALAVRAKGRPVVLPDPTADPRLEIPAEGARTGPLMAVVPTHGDDPLAYLRVARPKGGAQFRLVDAELLRAISDRLAFFLRLRGATHVA